MKSRTLGSVLLLSTIALGSVAALAEQSPVEDPMRRQAEAWGANNPGDAYTAYQLQHQGSSNYGSVMGNNGYQYPQYNGNDIWQQRRNLAPAPHGYRWVRNGDGAYVLQPRNRR